MNLDSDLLQYIETRKRFYEKLEVTKARLDHLLDALQTRPATMTDLARLEGLHHEKRALFADFAEKEERFVTQLLAKRSVRSDGDGATS
jgi:hypothetical protein